MRRSIFRAEGNRAGGSSEKNGTGKNCSGYCTNTDRSMARAWARRESASTSDAAAGSGGSMSAFRSTGAWRAANLPSAGEPWA